MTQAGPTSIVDRVSDLGDGGDPELRRLIEGLQRLQIIDSYPTLRSSPYEPRRLMSWVSNLDFIGHTASKWRLDPEFEPFLARVSEGGGRVRFLLSSDLQVAEATSLINFAHRYPALEVSVASHFPQLRLHIIDEQYVVLQHYEGRQQFAEGQNWDAPLVVIKRAADENSFFHGLRGYFDEMWRRSISLIRENN